MLYFQPGEVQKITPIPCKAGPAPGDMERQGSLRLVVERYPLRMTGPETPQQPLDNLTSLWQRKSFPASRGCVGWASPLPCA